MVDRIDVLFRVSKDDADDVYALFPGIVGTLDPTTCMSYQHVGQHGAADLHRCIGSSRPATPKEYAPLLKELRGRYKPYALRVVSRQTRNHYKSRLAGR